MKLQTLTACIQNGAQLHFTLSGNPDNVQREAYFLHNYGLAELPDDYEAGADSVTLCGNLYRLNKFAIADCEAKAMARGGWRAVRALRKGGNLPAMAKAKAKGILRAIRTSVERYEVRGLPEYASGAGRGDSGEHGGKWDVSPAMASVAAYGERVAGAAEFAASK